LWNADLVLGPRPVDYHPDHRYTGILLQDAAYMVTVPNVCPDTSALAGSDPGIARRNDPFAFSVGFPQSLRLNLLVGGDDESPWPMPQRDPVESAVVGSGPMFG
jgi:hypothetical protein